MKPEINMLEYKIVKQILFAMDGIQFVRNNHHIDKRQRQIEIAEIIINHAKSIMEACLEESNKNK